MEGPGDVITKEQWTDFALRVVPGFRQPLEDLREDWEPDPVALSIEMSEFSWFVAGLLKDAGRSEQVEAALAFVEDLLVRGDEALKDAAATSFLENLLNQVSGGELDPATFVDLLGPQSRAYCKAWDEFTGVKTPGL